MTLNQILLDSAATLDLEAKLPTGSELTLRINYANQATEDAAAMMQFSEFKQEYQLGITTLVTLPLPSNFREFYQNPQVLYGGAWVEIPEIEAEDKYAESSGGYWCYVLGNRSSGYNVVFNGLTSGMSLSIVYQRYPSGMVTLTDVCELPDPTFVTKKIESYVLYSRGDDKFQIAEARANNILLNMVGREMKGSGGSGRDTKTKFKNPLGD